MRGGIKEMIEGGKVNGLHEGKVLTRISLAFILSGYNSQ